MNHPRFLFAKLSWRTYLLAASLVSPAMRMMLTASATNTGVSLVCLTWIRTSCIPFMLAFILDGLRRCGPMIRTDGQIPSSQILELYIFIPVGTIRLAKSAGW